MRNAGRTKPILLLGALPHCYDLYTFFQDLVIQETAEDVLYLSIR